jgi:hypothetical protein
MDDGREFLRNGRIGALALFVNFITDAPVVAGAAALAKSSSSSEARRKVNRL